MCLTAMALKPWHTKVWLLNADADSQPCWPRSEHLKVHMNGNLANARSCRKMQYFLGSLALLAGFFGNPAAAQRPAAEAIAPEMRLEGGKVSIPFTMVGPYPFVQGVANGVSGKFLLDTGARGALSLNHHRIPMTGGKSIGSGSFGSGETYEVLLHDKAGPIAVDSLNFAEVTNVPSQDARQLERITPDFIGWFGYFAWDGYALKMDYREGVATFYKRGAEDFLAGEKILTVIPYEVRKLDNNPIMFVELGGVRFQTVLDTGQYGRVFTDAATQERLERGGWLKRSAIDPEAFDLEGGELPGGMKISLREMVVDHGTFPAAAPLGMESPNILSLGFAFLHQYKTVWDYPNKKIYLLQR